MCDRASHPAGAVERAFVLLEFLDSTQRRWNISELSRKLNLPKSTTYVLVTTLERLGYISREAGERAYGLTLKLSALGRSALKDLRLPALALPPMRALAQALRFTVHLAMLDRDQAIYVQKVEGPSFLRFDTYVGKRTNLHCTAVGKVLLAYSDPPMRKSVLSRLTFTRHTARTITSSVRLQGELDAIQKRGWAIDDQEEELEVRCLAVPVFDAAGQVAAALGIAATVTQLSEEDIPKVVRQMQEFTACIEAALQH